MKTGLETSLGILSDPTTKTPENNPISRRNFLILGVASLASEVLEATLPKSVMADKQEPKPQPPKQERVEKVPDLNRKKKKMEIPPDFHEIKCPAFAPSEASMHEEAAADTPAAPPQMQRKRQETPPSTIGGFPN